MTRMEKNAFKSCDFQFIDCLSESVLQREDAQTEVQASFLES